MAFFAGLIGTVSNILRLTVLDSTNIPCQLVSFIASLTAGLLASGINRFIGFPRITLTVPSIIIMVPGLFMYKGMYFFALENYSEGSFWFTKAFMVICALSLGLIFARILSDKNFRTGS